VIGLVVVAGAVIALVLASSGGDDESDSATPEQPARRRVFTEPVSDANNPFTPPVGEGDANIERVEPTGAQQRQSGGEPGLYGGTMQEGTCDAAQLVSFLQENPAKGRAWATTLGIDYEQIPDFVSSLTPVLLRADTRVTNHGYENGRATAIQVVLQAGTAVFVDEYGVPVTKCYCGNPLTTPRSFPPVYYGPRWPGFTRDSITVVIKNTTIIETFVLVDTRTGEGFNRPRGSDGSQDTPTTAPTTAPPTSTTRPPTSSTLPPATQPPTTQPSGPSAEELAIQKVQQAGSVSGPCYPFPAPIQDSTGGSESISNSTPSGFVLTVTTNLVGGGQQVFQWQVDRATLAFTPVNELATVASNHCSLLN
jgi:hypothetical protein